MVHYQHDGTLPIRWYTTNKMFNMCYWKSSHLALSDHDKTYLPDKKHNWIQHQLNQQCRPVIPVRAFLLCFAKLGMNGG